MQGQKNITIIDLPVVALGITDVVLLKQIHETFKLCVAAII